MRYRRYLTLERRAGRRTLFRVGKEALTASQFIWLLALLPLGGCTAGPALPARLDWPSNEPWKKRWVQAPIMVVGKAESVNNKGGSSIRRGGWSVEVRLHEINVEVENVIQGDVREGRIRVYRYGHFDGYMPGQIPIDHILPGERRVFFLLPFGRDYRMIEDVVAGSFRVASGRHRQLSKDKPVLQQIAEVLVLPGEGFDEEQYARDLDVQASSKVPALVGLRHTVLLLRELMSRGPKLVSAQACLSLYKLYPFGDSCIEGLLHDPGTPEPIRKNALETAKTYGGGKAKQLEQFKKQPVEWFNAWVDNERLMSYVAGTHKEDARFVLSELAERRDDPVVRRNARMLLQEYVPKI